MQLQYIPFEEIERSLRSATLLGQPDKRPYETAEISLTEMDPKEIMPAQFYLLWPTLHSLRYFRLRCLEIGLNLLKPEAGWKYEMDGEKYTLWPPVVEFSDADGVNIDCDGLHRLFLALDSNETCQVIYIRGVNPTMPYYGLPNPNGWNDVRVKNEVPLQEEKRRWRTHHGGEALDPLQFRRDFRPFGLGGIRVAGTINSKGV